MRKVAEFGVGGCPISAINTRKDSVNISCPNAVWRLVEDTRKQEEPVE